MDGWMDTEHGGIQCADLLGGVGLVLKNPETGGRQQVSQGVQVAFAGAHGGVDGIADPAQQDATVGQDGSSTE